MTRRQQTTTPRRGASAGDAAITITKRSRSLSGGTWYIGTAGSLCFEALVFTEPSRFGIDEGQVSKLYVLDGTRKQYEREVACYERGWDLRPAEAEVQEAITRIIDDLSRREREQYQTAEACPPLAGGREEDDGKVRRRGREGGA